MYLIDSIQTAVVNSLNSLFENDFSSKDFQINQTKTEFEGDYTVVLFSLLKKHKMEPVKLGETLGNHLIDNNKDLFEKYNVIQGFLNLTISNTYWSNFINTYHNIENFGVSASNGKKVMIEYSSPNTNKPLHLGHLRNNFLGWSIGEILKASGYDVIRTSIVNDRGIHICKSMYAWQKFANGETPESSGIKGDHLVGDYYVKFENELKKQSAELVDKESINDYSDYSNPNLEKIKQLKLQIEKLKEIGEEKTKEKIEKINEEIIEIRRSSTPIMKEVQKMLLDWELGKPEVIQLWEKMNGWVYQGMNQTYEIIGSSFDKTYYESNTYLIGKDILQEGLDKNVFYRKDDSSVWIDLTKDGLDEKLVLRKDGTSVYITQDIGLAKQKYEEFGIDKSIYVVGDEQNYHFKVLQAICKRLEFPYANDIFHLSYGMVELPDGKMKSREGNVVDADDILEEMEAEACKKTEDLGKVKDFTSVELEELYKTIGIGALKFFLLRVDPKKRMVFNPEESIDFHGFTAPFIQFNYARIKSILRKNNSVKLTESKNYVDYLLLEKELMVILEKFPAIINQANNELNPSVIANYVYLVAKTFSTFYTEHSITNAETDEKKQLRLQLATMTANIIKLGMGLLGINVPERM